VLCRWGGKEAIREARDLRFKSRRLQDWWWLPIIFFELKTGTFSSGFTVPVGKLGQITVPNWNY